MKCICRRDMLGMKLSKLGKFVGGAKLVPIYSNYLIKVKENNMEITSGDGNTFVTDTYSMVQTEEVGQFTVDAKKFSKLIDSLGAKEEITLELVEHKLVVRSGKSKFKLDTIDAEQYPELPTEYENKLGKLPLKDLQTALRCAKVCVAKDMTNPYLTGFKIDNDLFSSDSLKICIYNQNFGGIKSLVSSVCVEAILSHNDSEEILVSKHGNSIMFSSEGFKVVSNLISGIEKFPQSEAFVNQEFEYKVKFNRASLLPIINRATIFVKEDLSNAIKLVFDKGNLIVSSFDSKEQDTTNEVLECDHSGVVTEALVDGIDLADVISSLVAEEFHLEFDGPEKEGNFIKISQDKLSYIISILDLNEGKENA